MAMGGIRLGLCSAVIIGLTGPLDYVAAQDQGGVTVQFDVSEQLELQRRSGGGYRPLRRSRGFLGPI